MALGLPKIEFPQLVGIYSTFGFVEYIYSCFTTDSAEVQRWMKELDGFNIPDLTPTINGSCLLDPANAANAASRGWWTCGGYTRDTGMFLS